MPRSRLRNVTINSVHLVDFGDNPEARFVMLKRRPEPGITDDEIENLIEQEADISPTPTTQAEAYEQVRKLATENNITFTEALQSDVGRRIYEAALDLYADPADDADAVTKTAAEDDAPSYLRQAAERIALRDNISTERAFGLISKQHPDLAERYRTENS